MKPGEARRRIALFVLAGMVLASGLATGCQRRALTAPDVTLSAELAPRPPRVGPATITVQVRGIGGAPLAGAVVRVEADMAHPGMAPVFGDAREVQPGKYQAPLEFTMGGDWFATVTVTLADGRKLERQIDVPGVRSR
jgi:hypothetical protein